MQVFTQVLIFPAHSGFGMYQAGELQVGESSYAFREDLLSAIAENADEILPIAEAESIGAEDISNKIYGNAGELFVCKNRDGNIEYFGIVESKVAEDLLK